MNIYSQSDSRKCLKAGVFAEIISIRVSESG